MAYYDTDWGEREHRRALAIRALETDRRYSLGATNGELENLTGGYDGRLRARHDEFIQNASRSDIQWYSPRLNGALAEGDIDTVVAAIKDQLSTSDHVTHRMGSVELPTGKLFWAIRKPSNLRELFQAVRKGSSFSLELWHPDDVAESLVPPSRGR